MTPQERPAHSNRSFLLHSRLRSHACAVDRAREAITCWLSQCDRPYIACSGGKDSLCVLHLIREQRPDTPAVYFDAECAFPEVSDWLDRTANVIRYPADEPILETIARLGLDAGKALEAATLQSTVYGPIRRLIAQYGYDGVAYGLRGEEHRNRQIHRAVRGPVFRYKRDGLLCCQPIANWTYRDVWAFVAARELDYCAVYDRMWDMPEREQRVSYWAGETNRQNGRYLWLKRNYPELWNRLAAMIPGVRAYA